MGLLLDPIPNSSNWHHYNCMEDSKENYIEILGVKGRKIFGKTILLLLMINKCLCLPLSENYTLTASIVKTRQQMLTQTLKKALAKCHSG